MSLIPGFGPDSWVPKGPMSLSLIIFFHGMSSQDDLEVIEIEKEQPELEIGDENHQPSAFWSRHDENSK